MKVFHALLMLFFFSQIEAQSLSAKLSAALIALDHDIQCKHAITSMYVINSKTGELVLNKNGQVGLAPASCQKIITSVTAFEMLGKEYRYSTAFILKSDLRTPGTSTFEVSGSGDPSLGSPRFANTSERIIYKNIYQKLSDKKITALQWVVTNDLLFNNTSIPRGWPWEDVGNYYGAGAHQLNWRENQYDVEFISKGPQTYTIVKSITPVQPGIRFRNLVTAGPEGSADNGYLFFEPGDSSILIQGTIPPNKNSFVISGAMPDPPKVFISGLRAYLSAQAPAIVIGNSRIVRDQIPNDNTSAPTDGITGDTIYRQLSPAFDSLNYWFLKKSINLYGEAFLRTIAYEKSKVGSTDSGVAVIKEFWSKRGVDRASVNIFDGSGLSPANRVTANALVTVMQYARSRSWFSSFYNALPETNDIKMKDGYIGGVRTYTGYVNSRDGNAYTFCIMVNNFDGNPAEIRQKIWAVLDLMK